MFHSLYLTTNFVSSIQTLHLSLQTLTLTFISSTAPPPLLHDSSIVDDIRSDTRSDTRSISMASFPVALQDPTLSQEIRHYFSRSDTRSTGLTVGYLSCYHILFIFLLFESSMGNVSDLPFGCGFVNDGACGWKIWQDLWVICSRSVLCK